MGSDKKNVLSVLLHFSGPVMATAGLSNNVLQRFGISGYDVLGDYESPL